MVATNVRYKSKPFFGRIQATLLANGKPVEYSLAIYHDRQGKIATSRTLFDTVDKAVGHATLYGFLPYLWGQET
jgi:hypothetical protein